MMIPWKAVGTLTPLMIFSLVFFLSQCYSRFMTLFDACQTMETAIHDMTVIVLVHATRHEHRWDVVRYLTAAAITAYGRALGNNTKPRSDIINWKRLRSPEAYFLPWSRAASAVELAHTVEPHAELGTSATPPESRPISCPALLDEHEVNELLQYPDSMVCLVLVTWCVQTLKELESERNGGLKGPAFGQTQGELPPTPPRAPQTPFSSATRARISLCEPASALKLRAASCKIFNLLNLPIPLPYYLLTLTLALALLALTLTLTPA